MLISLKFWKLIKPKKVVFVILMLQMYVVFGQKKVIIIDPGHGGKDTGAIGVNGLKEKDVVLKVAKEMIRLNKTIFKNELEIYLTRYKDTLISLSDRTKLTKSLQANVFVSLHCNYSKSFSRGIEVYVHNSEKPNIQTSIVLGISILDESTQKLGIKNRGVKFASFQVLRKAYPLPAVLFEIGFLSNKDEANYLLKYKNIRSLALSTLAGITNYIKQEL